MRIIRSNGIDISLYKLLFFFFKRDFEEEVCEISKTSLFGSKKENFGVVEKTGRSSRDSFGEIFGEVSRDYFGEI
jgi:hypothetical protein